MQRAHAGAAEGEEAVTFYNEIDPFAAAWLRELMAADLIAPGIVDERSITEIDPNELDQYTQCHFFAGIGGWSYALRLAGWPDERPVWTGSCPCQPLSCAGQRKGHADERHLWPAFYRLIAKCRPAAVFGEQVAGKDGREWFCGVRADLEGIGYAIGGADLCAAGSGAKHIRQRIYWVADAIRDKQPRPEQRHGTAGRVGRIEQPVSWDRDWQGALREFRALDDGLSYGVEAVDGPRNAIVPQVAATFIQAAAETH